MLSNPSITNRTSQRLGQKAQVIEQALSSVTADGAIFEEIVDAWIDSFEKKHELPSFRFIR